MTSDLFTSPPQFQVGREEEQEEEPPPPAPPPGRSVPAFYFPRGRPQTGAWVVDDVIADVERAFASFPQERAGLDDMGAVAKVGGSWGRVFVIGWGLGMKTVSIIFCLWAGHGRDVIVCGVVGGA